MHLSTQNDSHRQKKAYLRAALDFFDSAAVSAAEGDLNASAILILQALANERRAKIVGPQILQLIKTIK